MILKNIKFRLKQTFKDTPVWPVLRALNNSRKYMAWLKKRRKLSKGGTIFAFDPDKIHYIDPRPILFRTRDARMKGDHMGSVSAGDWDEWDVRWDDHDQVRWLKEHFVEGIPWKETAYYRAYSRFVETGEWVPPHSEIPGLRHLVPEAQGGRDDDFLDETYTPAGAMDQRCKELDELYESVKRHGVLPQRELPGRIPDPLKDRDNIVVSIGRHGDFLFTDGKHRFTLAKILGLESIPVKICRRHCEWVDFRNKIDLYVTRHGKLYQPLTHPDLDDFPSAHNDSRVDIIHRALPVKSGTLVDIGANWGFFCRTFERSGFNCTAMEHDPEAVYFMKKLRRSEGCSFDIIEGDLLGHSKPITADVVLALSIFHHLVRTDDLERQLIQFLKLLDVNFMILEANIKGEDIVKDYANDYGGDLFPQFIIRHSCLKSFEQIGTEPENGRPIYLLRR